MHPAVLAPPELGAHLLELLQGELGFLELEPDPGLVREPDDLALDLDRAEVGPPEHHALGEEPLEGLVHRDQAHVVEHLGEKPRVEEVEHGVLDAADVLVHRHPEVGLLAVEGEPVVLGVGVAEVVPGGVHEGVHGVGVAPGGAAALRAGGLDELGVGLEGALSFGADLLDVLDLGELDRELTEGHRHHPAVLAVDHGDRRAPVALAADQPVAEAVVHRPLAQALFLEPGGDLGLPLLARGAVEGARVHHHPGRFKGLLQGLWEVAVLGLDDGADFEAILLRELEVPLVVGGHRHDGAGAVAHEHVVGHVDGDLLAGGGVFGVGPGEDPGLLAALGLALDLGLLLRGLDVGPDLVEPVRGGEVERKRVLGCDHHEGGAEEGVGPRGEDLEGLAGVALDGEVDLGALAFPDPGPLHGLDLLRPALELVEVLKEPVGVGGDLEEPLLELLLLDQGVLVAPAAAVDHLLVGEHGLALGAPVDLGLGAVGEAPLEHLDEEPLVPLVVVGLAGGDLAVPVVEDAHQVEGLLGPLDVLVGPLAGVEAELEGGVLRGQAEGVPAHGVEHLEALHLEEAGQGVAHGVVLEVAHVEVAGGVGEHLEHVELLPLLLRLHQADLVPVALPLGLDGVGVVLLHGSSREKVYAGALRPGVFPAPR